LLTGYAHAKAATAETVIGLVLVVGLVATFVSPGASRTMAIAAQAFALLGTMVGLLTIAVGVGPRTAPDLVFHAAILAVLAFGLARVVGAHRRPQAT
jgi:hypothetical protein